MSRDHGVDVAAWHSMQRTTGMCNLGVTSGTEAAGGMGMGLDKE